MKDMKKDKSPAVKHFTDELVKNVQSQAPDVRDVKGKGGGKMADKKKPKEKY